MSQPDPLNWEARRINGDTYIKIGDVLAWLREREDAWAGCRLEEPSRVAAHFADTLRDSWMDSDVPRQIGGER